VPPFTIVADVIEPLLTTIFAVALTPLPVTAVRPTPVNVKLPDAGV
jgi:hypothetical protein